MKKRILIISIIVLMLTLITGSIFVFAEEEGLTLVESYPRDGQKNAAVENLGVKLTFSDPVNLESNQEANNACFSLSGPDGDMPIQIYYNPDIPEQVLVLHDRTETENTNAARSSEEYVVKISGDFMDNEGNTLGADKTITFRTTDVRRNNIIYFVLMAVMMGGMIFFSSRQARNQAAQAAESGTAQPEVFNPYKEAKRTGKSLTEVIAEHDKEVAKQKAKQTKRMIQEEYDDYEEVEEAITNYKVKGPRPISAAGSTYITGRKALAEAKAAEEERLARRRAKNKKK